MKNPAIFFKDLKHNIFLTYSDQEVFLSHNKRFRWHLVDYEKHNFSFHLKACEGRNFDFCVLLRMCSVSDTLHIRKSRFFGDK